MVRPKEQKLVLWSFLYFLSLMSGYFTLRPLRDEMGIINGVNNMHWLFTGTFVVLLLVVPLFGVIIRKYQVKKVLCTSIGFFVSNLIIFYLFFALVGKSGKLASTFFIWLSVFNLFVVSLFWSFMTDIFSSKASKRVFGIIAAGGSFGALIGSITSSLVAQNSSAESLLLLAISFFLLSIVLVMKITKLKTENPTSSNLSVFNPNVILKKSFWRVFLKVLQSKYLLNIISFILLYTSVSTFLYFEQAYILEKLVADGSKRIVYFSRVDLVTNIIAISSQFFITNRIIKRYGLKIALCGIPLLLALGVLIMSFKLSLFLIAVLIILHRAGNFSILRPSREILYTVCTKEEKYQTKNFIDTVVYRGGDALTSWVFTLLVSLGFGLSVIALIAVPIILLWSFTGYQLGEEHNEKEKELIINVIS